MGKVQYVNSYNKNNYKQFHALLKPEEYQEIEKIVKELHINKAEFVRLSIKLLKKEKGLK